MRSWQTTGIGICLLLLAIGTAGQALFDGDPESVVNLAQIVEALAGLGFVFTRTERQHRKDNDKGPPTSTAVPLLFGLLTASMVLGGCATPSAYSGITANGTVGQGVPANIAVMANDGLQSASFQGAAPTHIKQDSTGAWITTPGQGGATVITLPNGISAYIWSPLDGEVGAIRVTPEPAPGQMMLEITGLKFNISEHARAVASMYALAMDAIKDMTREEAERRLGEMQVAGEITATVADALLRSFVPTLPVG